MGKWQRIGWYAAIAVLAVSVVGGCRREKAKAETEREVRVTLEPLQKRIFRHQIPVQGTVWPVEYATISAKISGTLELLQVDEGDRRKKGEVLFGIDRQVLKNQVTVREDEVKVKQAELDSARIALESAEITRRKAKQDYERFLKLWEANAASQTVFESYDAEFQKAEMGVKSAQATIINAGAQLKQAEGNLTIARKNLDDCVLKAPFDCVVADKYVEENEYVAAGQKILKLENQTRLEVECYISAIYYDQIQIGKTRVHFSLDGADKGQSVVSYKSPSIDPESRTFKLKVQIPEHVNLVSGTLCDLQLILEEKEAYGLPADALLLRANNRTIVYAIDAQRRAGSVEVSKGIDDGAYCEILNADKLLKMRFVVTGQTFVNNGTLLREIQAK